MDSLGIFSLLVILRTSSIRQNIKNTFDIRSRTMKKKRSSLQFVVILVRNNNHTFPIRIHLKARKPPFPFCTHATWITNGRIPPISILVASYRHLRNRYGSMDTDKPQTKYFNLTWPTLPRTSKRYIMQDCAKYLSVNFK